jgi:hypothetical protein
MRDTVTASNKENKMKRGLFLLATMLVVATATATAADIYIVKSNKTIGDSRSQEQEWMTRMWIAKDYIRIEEPEGKTVNITDFAKGELITLDTENNEYFTIPLKQIHDDFVRGAAGMKQRMDLKWRVEGPTDGGVIAGYKCKKIIFHGAGTVEINSRRVEQRITMTIWFSDQLVGVEETSQRLLEVMGLDKHPFLGESVLAELKRIGGFHLKAIVESEVDGKIQGVEQTVDEFSVVESDPTLFEIPAGYKQVSQPVNR